MSSSSPFGTIPRKEKQKEGKQNNGSNPLERTKANVEMSDHNFDKILNISVSAFCSNSFAILQTKIVVTDLRLRNKKFLDLSLINEVFIPYFLL